MNSASRVAQFSTEQTHSEQNIYRTRLKWENNDRENRDTVPLKISDWKDAVGRRSFLFSSNQA